MLLSGCKNSNENMAKKSNGTNNSEKNETSQAKEYELENVEDYLNEKYEENINIKKGYEVKVKEKISGDKDFDEATDSIYVYNIDGEWYIDESPEHAKNFK